MVWDYFCSSGVGYIHFLEGTMYEKKYRKNLEDRLLLFVRYLKLKRGWTFQQDNYPMYTDMVQEENERHS